MNILLASHGDLCTGVLSAFNMFAGGASDIRTVSLTNDGGVDLFRSQLDEALNDLLAKGDVLILVDLKGGTPYNESYMRFLQNPEHIRLAAGLNLPMLIEAGVLAMSGGELDAVYQTAITAGANGVVGTELPEESSNDEDDLF